MHQIKYEKIERALDIINEISLPCGFELYSVETYCNGREQGFCLNLLVGPYANWRKIVFAENRNSDDLVLYHGLYSQFNADGNVPGQVAYDNKLLYEKEENIIKTIEGLIAQIARES